MARNRDAGPPCRVCGGATEAVSAEDPQREPAKSAPKRRCADTDCVGRDWWLQVTGRRA
ncbi:MAG: hypothetical protein ABWY93_31905 [Mycobacterium sp.]